MTADRTSGKPLCLPLIFVLYRSLSFCIHFYFCATGFHLSKRRKFFVVFCYICIEDSAIVLCHIQCRMAKQPLKRERITAAIYKIFTSKGVTKKMDACLLDTSLFVIVRNAASQAVLCELCAAFIREKKIIPLPHHGYANTLLKRHREHHRGELPAPACSLCAVSKSRGYPNPNHELKYSVSWRLCIRYSAAD